MIQLAIPMEPGNSGGPLLDMKGKVQGILNMKSLVTENLGFAIPINALKPLIKNPNTVPLEKWMAIGALNPAAWQPILGGQWRRKAGMITVQGTGPGFGGRSLCLSQLEVPELPYEIAVTVLLDDEAGAAGLAFASDGEDRHYGFYPSAGQLRLTRFDGPNLFTWHILRQIESPFYRPGEWNRLKVRVEPEKILCYVNDHLVAEVQETVARPGKTGLAKFRETKAQFKNFQLGKSLPSPPARDEVLAEQARKALANPGSTPTVPDDLLAKPAAARELLMRMARDLDQKAAEARAMARELNQKSVEHELVRLFQVAEPQIDLFAAALLIARLETPELDPSAYQAEIDAMAQEIRAGWSEATTSREKLNDLRTYLFEDNGYHGSRSDYYNHANSFINRVIDDREGIPITLSVLFLELGGKLGIEKLEGMPFPGHFMVRFTNGDEESLYIDVFDSGKIYRKNELYSLISNHSEVPLLEEHFQPATKREIVARILKNLVATSMRRETPARTLPYLDLLVALSPDDPINRWRRATLRLQSGRRTLARDDLRWLLEHQAAEFDLEQIEELYRNLKP
jgi:serine protease Do